MDRYETRMRRSYERAVENLCQIRDCRKTENFQTNPRIPANNPQKMIEVTTNYSPNPAPPRYVYLGRQQPKEEPKAETPNANTTALPQPVEWSDFVLILIRALMPFPDARDAVLAAIEAYEGASP